MDSENPGKAPGAAAPAAPPPAAGPKKVALPAHSPRTGPKYPKVTIVEFSFLLAVPTMLAATGLDLIKEGGTFSSADYGVLAVGFVTSFVVALIAIKWLLKFIKNHSFTAFGVYRIIAAILFFLYVGNIAA